MRHGGNAVFASSHLRDVDAGANGADEEARGFFVHLGRPNAGDSRPAGGCGGSGLAPPTPAVAELVAGTEPRRRRGGVRLMLNRVSYY